MKRLLKQQRKVAVKNFRLKRNEEFFKTQKPVSAKVCYICKMSLEGRGVWKKQLNAFENPVNVCIFCA